MTTNPSPVTRLRSLFTLAAFASMKGLQSLLKNSRDMIAPAQRTDNPYRGAFYRVETIKLGRNKEKRAVGKGWYRSEGDGAKVKTLARMTMLADRRLRQRGEA